MMCLIVFDGVNGLYQGRPLLWGCIALGCIASFCDFDGGADMHWGKAFIRLLLGAIIPTWVDHPTVIARRLLQDA